LKIDSKAEFRFFEKAVVLGKSKIRNPKSQYPPNKRPLNPSYDSYSDVFGTDRVHKALRECNFENSVFSVRSVRYKKLKATVLFPFGAFLIPLVLPAITDLTIKLLPILKPVLNKIVKNYQIRHAFCEIPLFMLSYLSIGFS